MQVLEGHLPLVLLAEAQEGEGVQHVDAAWEPGEVNQILAIVILEKDVLDGRGWNLQQRLEFLHCQVIEAWGHPLGLVSCGGDKVGVGALKPLIQGAFLARAMMDNVPEAWLGVEMQMFVCQI